MQFANGRLELSWRVQVLRHRTYGLHEHLRRKKLADDKTLNARVNALADKELRRLMRLQAEIEHQNDQRQRGIYTPDTPAGSPAGSPATAAVAP